MSSLTTRHGGRQAPATVIDRVARGLASFGLGNTGQFEPRVCPGIWMTVAPSNISSDSPSCTVVSTGVGVQRDIAGPGERAPGNDPAWVGANVLTGDKGGVCRVGHDVSLRLLLEFGQAVRCGQYGGG